MAVSLQARKVFPFRQRWADTAACADSLPGTEGVPFPSMMGDTAACADSLPGTEGVPFPSTVGDTAACADSLPGTEGVSPLAMAGAVAAGADPQPSAAGVARPTGAGAVAASTDPLPSPAGVARPTNTKHIQSDKAQGNRCFRLSVCGCQHHHVCTTCCWVTAWPQGLDVSPSPSKHRPATVHAGKVRGIKLTLTARTAPLTGRSFAADRHGLGRCSRADGCPCRPARSQPGGSPRRP
jgi:hypothetical protein